MIIRRALLDDIPSMQKLYIETIKEVNRHDYTLKQIEDWASCGIDKKRWLFLFDEFNFFVCIIKSEVTGFTSINSEGFIHTMFVSKDFQRQGVGQYLLNYLFSIGDQKDIKTYTAEVSITAKLFFERNGFKVIKEQMAQANKLRLKNFVMEKRE